MDKPDEVIIKEEKPIETDPKEIPTEIWECVIKDFNITITLTVDSTKVRVSKFPKEYGENDHHLFRDGDQYVLLKDTLYLIDSEGNICGWFDPFAITRISEDKIELEYLGILIDIVPCIMRTYLFNRKIEE